MNELAQQPHRTGFSLAELLASLAVTAILLATVLPVVAGAGTLSGVAVSQSNLITIGVAHSVYAADNGGRQWTNIDDEISTFGDNPGIAFSGYSNACGGGGAACWHPPLILGWGQDDNSEAVIFFRYFQAPGYTGNHGLVVPVRFSGTNAGVGAFRLMNTRPLHDYVNGRFYDPTFYAPNDTVAYDLVEPVFYEPWEFPDVAPITGDGDLPYWSSYCLSPSAMFHPDVMRSEADGGWQDPWTLPHGFASPSLAQVAHPSLKTWTLEHHWNQSRPADVCNPGFPLSSTVWRGPDDPVESSCEPWYFNHGLASAPVTLFYDLAVRDLPNAEVLAADQQLISQTGYGLWSRDTPFGADGYRGDIAFDDTRLSHHILTTDGILGRDTLGPATSPERTRPTGRTARPARPAAPAQPRPLERSR